MTQSAGSEASLRALRRRLRPMLAHRILQELRWGCMTKIGRRAGTDISGQPSLDLCNIRGFWLNLVIGHVFGLLPPKIAEAAHPGRERK